MESIINIQELKERFLSYANSYLTGDEFDYGYIAKRDHTVRVFEITQQIARVANVDNQTFMVIEAIAILHDVGRFTEWQIYKSYKRKKEFDHATEGGRMLREGIIKKMIPQTRQFDELIICGVERHGDMVLPDTLSKQERMICEIIRDADRLDIFYLCTREQDFDRMYNLEVGSKHLSADIKDRYIQGEPINIFNLKSKFDLLALRCGLIKQLTTKASKKFVVESDLLNRMVDFFKEKLPYYDGEEVEWLREETIKCLLKEIS